MEQRDIPIQTLKDDEFGIEKYVNALRDFIRNSGTPPHHRASGGMGQRKVLLYADPGFHALRSRPPHLRTV